MLLFSMESPHCISQVEAHGPRGWVWTGLEKAGEREIVQLLQRIGVEILAEEQSEQSQRIQQHPTCRKRIDSGPWVHILDREHALDLTHSNRFEGLFWAPSSCVATVSVQFHAL